MTALYIIGGILLFFFLIGMIRAEVVISYAEEFGLTVRIAGIPIRILPTSPKKDRLKDYTPAAMEKKRKKAEKKEKSKAEKKAKKERKKEKDKQKKAEAEKAGKAKKKTSLKDIEKIIRLITSVVKTAVTRFAKSLRIRVARLHVGVATGDAAQTAVMYGAVTQAVSYLAYLLDSTSTLRYPAKSDVSIYADFLSEKPVLDIEIGLSICVWQVFDLLFRSAGAAIRELIKS
ncbi:MAG: hypothetical protein MJ137_07265 [Clostridia bacterium]|nr:hypothetical protein [Clostridia bacterium]